MVVGDVCLTLFHPFGDGSGENVQQQAFGLLLFGLELVEEVFGVNGVSDAQGQVLQIDRFVQKIVRASRNAHHPLLAFGERGDHQDRDGRRLRVFLQPPADFEAVHVGHHHVQQDDVGSAFCYFLQSVCSPFSASTIS